MIPTADPIEQGSFSVYGSFRLLPSSPISAKQALARLMGFGHRQNFQKVSIIVTRNCSRHSTLVWAFSDNWGNC